MHSLVDKLKWFYENARCYNKTLCTCFLYCNRKVHRDILVTPVEIKLMLTLLAVVKLRNIILGNNCFVPFSLFFLNFLVNRETYQRYCIQYTTMIIKIFCTQWPKRHQELLLCVYSNWYMSCVYIDWLLAGSVLILSTASKNKSMTYTSWCIYRLERPDDEQ